MGGEKTGPWGGDAGHGGDSGGGGGGGIIGETVDSDNGGNGGEMVAGGDGAGGSGSGGEMDSGGDAAPFSLLAFLPFLVCAFFFAFGLRGPGMTLKSK